MASGDPRLYAVDPKTGAALFNVDTGDWFAAGPILEDGKIFLLGKDGTLLALTE